MSQTRRRSPQPALYLTTVTVVHAGRWKVSAVEGILAVPRRRADCAGTFQPLGAPAAPSTQDIQKYLAAKVQPPVLKVDQNRQPFHFEHHYWRSEGHLY